MNEIICGVDVAKEWLDAHVEPGGASGRFGNDATGIAELAAFCKAHGVGLVVMEASGGFERVPFILLWQAGQPCGLVNARNVRRFAEAMGFLEKTDAIDAHPRFAPLVSACGRNPLPASGERRIPVAALRAADDHRLEPLLAFARS